MLLLFYNFDRIRRLWKYLFSEETFIQGIEILLNIVTIDGLNSSVMGNSFYRKVNLSMHYGKFERVTAFHYFGYFNIKNAFFI